MYAEEVWLRLRDARDELANNCDEGGLHQFVDVVVRLPNHIIPDTDLLSDAAADELLDISDKFESYKIGMSYDMYVKEVPIEKRYEHLNAHFAATNIQLGGVTWDAIMRIWVEFRSKYVTIKHVLDNGQVSGAPIGDILNGVTRMMHLIETYHGK